MPPRPDGPRPRPRGKPAPGAGKGRPARPLSKGTGKATGKGTFKGGAKVPAKKRAQRQERAEADKQVMRPGWGSVTRRGAGRVRPPADGGASGAWRRAVDEAREADGAPPPAWEPEQWTSEPVRKEATHAVARGARPPARRDVTAPSPAEPAKVDASVAGLSPAQSARIQQRLKDATRAFERERYDEARRLLKPLADRVPGSAPIRELLGLTFYRQGRWRDAIRELEAFRGLTGSTEQHPVLADSFRALHRWEEAGALWDELRASSPSAELVTEGRIVAAGALADQGRVPDAVRLLEQGMKATRRPRPHHLRLWYALADLYERAGDVPHARQLFRRVVDVEPAFADAADRLRSVD